jgi:hypothetical protein
VGYVSPITQIALWAGRGVEEQERKPMIESPKQDWGLRKTSITCFLSYVESIVKKYNIYL